MITRTPVKSLVDLKMTHWYLSREPIIKDAINKYPPGYYIYNGNGETYRLIGWSNPEEKRGESEVYVYLERDVIAGTERLRIHPNYITPEEEILEISQAQEVHPVPVLIGYNVGKEIIGEVKFLTDPSTNLKRLFESVDSAEGFLLAHNMATGEDLQDFIYEPVFN